MLYDNAYYQSDVVHAIATAAGDDAGQEITAILRDELVFWQTESPKLAVGWWNNTEPAERRETLRNRYGLLSQGLRELEERSYPPSQEIVTQIRDFWLSLPQLNENKNISESCEQVLAILDMTAPRPAGPKQP